MLSYLTLLTTDPRSPILLTMPISNAHTITFKGLLQLYTTFTLHDHVRSISGPSICFPATQIIIPNGTIVAPITDTYIIILVVRTGMCGTTRIFTMEKNFDNKENNPVVLISNIPLQKVANISESDQVSALVPVSSTKNNIRSIALAVATGTPILLQGPIGCGKTVLVEHLAEITGRKIAKKFIKVQLGDQTDSKLLLGTYCCTDVPGEFNWQPGSLTQAVKNGAWILLEDIDYAPMDVLSILVPLLESKTLLLPGNGGQIQAADGFHLFATQRLSASGLKVHQSVQASSNITEKLWTKLNVQPLSPTELDEVIQGKWPNLKLVVQRILQVYFMFSSGQHQELNEEESEGKFLFHDGRLTSTRDLFKWCERISSHFDLSSTASCIKVFQDAIDCFCCSISKPSLHIPMAEAVASRFNITKAKAEFYCKNYKPDYLTTTTNVIVGRGNIPKRNVDEILLKSSLEKFSFTRPSLNLLERVCVAVGNKEPVLLVGETGTGKTSTVQFLAKQSGNKLIVINMNQQSDSTDLLGGFKPIEFKHLVIPIRNEFEELFCSCYNRDENVKFLKHLYDCMDKQRWQVLFKLILHCADKYRVGTSKKSKKLRNKWNKLTQKVNHLQLQLKRSSNALAFSFIEGSLVKAIRDGHWLLLDEINLASPETLECLSGLLESNTGSVLLLEKGDIEPVPRHENFHLFACMNPATDVGKKDLPPGLRNRFTEFFVQELEDKNDLQILISDYLKGLSLNASQLMDMVQFYLDIRQQAKTKLVDGTGQKPHYSLRTLCRALSYAATNSHGSVPRSLYESFCLSFLTQLDAPSHEIVNKMISKQIIGRSNVRTVIKQSLPQPSKGDYICVEDYWISQGDLKPKPTDDYILTDTVRKNLHNLVRIIAAKKHPVLLQGETSVGKTSLISYVAKLTGNRCVRINNHEHTDLQEYVGSYASDSSGKLVFKVGVLVDAMKKGHWIILDELNLAPSEVLEALNRVLDDNRELYITETQETVTAHPRFMLFATQNPAGQYGGRKILSRAFRNRFIELHFNEIPAKELEQILNQRCSVAPTHCKKLVAIMFELQARRKESSVFAGKQGFITLRDLFRWGERYKQAKKPLTGLYDWDQHLADEGYILLSGRSRRSEDDAVICQVLFKHLRRKVDSDRLFTLNEDTSPVTKLLLEEILTSKTPGYEHVVWTANMRRLAVLVGKTIQFKEPALLVGETGCGKTTICHMFAAIASKLCYGLNCHMHSESADFLGGLRPVRHHETEEIQKLFEWVDGPLVKAMISGSYFLADEISLAEDSVLERLNSVLESEQSLLLAEKGACDDNVEFVVAQPGFHFLATMNPGGDYGKKELSPALRNRFTEIWCPSEQKDNDLLQIIRHNLLPHVFLGPHDNDKNGTGKAILSFIKMFNTNSIGQKYKISIRDILSWVHFINTTTKLSQLSVTSAYIHGACLVFLDLIGTSSIGFINEVEINRIRQTCIEFLLAQMKEVCGCEVTNEDFGLFEHKSTEQVEVHSNETQFGVDPFYIVKGPVANQSLTGIFTLLSTSSYLNTQRILRALQLDKPILLEGSPGVGKTSLVAALARASGRELIRINLSEQTDVSDLFGADLPVEGGSRGQFAWRDGPLLKAMKAGNWVCFDEMNLASQSVLEGLNACLDYRKEIFIPELGCTFYIGSQSKGLETRIFACQNPLSQGGGRKGLPRSFLNRFTQVYIEPLLMADLQFITKTMFPDLSDDSLMKMITFNEQIHKEVVIEKRWGQRGSPWEFNLRDVFRWAELVIGNQTSEMEIGTHVDLVYKDRLRSRNDRLMLDETFRNIFGTEIELIKKVVPVFINESLLQIGSAYIPRCQYATSVSVDLSSRITQFLLLHRQLPVLESIMTCLQKKWMSILVGQKSSGKTTLVKILAQLTGNELQILTLNSATDTMDLLGGFEQNEMSRSLEYMEKQLLSIGTRMIHQCKDDAHLSAILKELEKKMQMNTTKATKVSSSEEMAAWNERIKYAKDLLLDLRKSGLYLDEIDEVEKKLVGAEKQMQMLKDSPTAGGQFEWVDSVLVQAVKHGHWLLLDNVNFCSPSVLDRLNALLEPNGVLTINERGIIDGEIVTIKPHSDFRLILAMDPKVGEISRAMRNRGVEIYVFGEEEEDISDLDMHRLLNSIGILSLSLQKLLLEIHYEVREKFSVWEKPNCLDLFRVAFLTVQQMSFGVDIKVAVGHSCTDTYVGSQRNKTKKKELLELVNQKLLNLTLTTDLSENLIPSVADFSHESAHALVENQMVVLQCLCNNITKKKKNYINYYIDAVENPEDFVFLAIKVFLQHTSPEDLEIRKLQLDYLFQQLQLNDSGNSRLWKHFVSFCKKILDDKTISQFMTSKRLSGDLPIDLRWTPQLQKSLVLENKMNEKNLDDISRFSNRFYLWLNFQLLNYKLSSIQENVETKITGTKKVNKVNRVHLDQDFASILVDLKNLLTLLNEIIMKQLTSPTNANYDDDEMKNIEIVLLWMQRLHNFINISVPTIDSSRVDAQLSLHWMWFRENCLHKMFGENLPKKVKVIEIKIDNQLALANNPAYARCEFLRRSLGTVSPFKTVEQAQAFQILKRLNEKFGVCSTTDFREFENMNKKLQKVSAVLNGGKVRIELQDAFVKVFNDTDVGDVAIEMSNLEHTLRTRDLDVLPTDDYKVQLWPVSDQFSIVNEMELLHQLFLVTDHSEVLSSLQTFTVGMMHTTALPSHMAAYISFCSTVKQMRPTTHHLYRIYLEFYNRIERCPATHKPDSWLQWRVNRSSDAENKDRTTFQIQGSNGILCALQSHAAANLLLLAKEDLDDEISSFCNGLQLGTCYEKCQQLSNLTSAWWRNVPHLSSKTFDAKINNFKFLLGVIRRTLIAVGLEKSINIDTAIPIEQLCKCVKKILEKDLHKFLDLLIIAVTNIDQSKRELDHEDVKNVGKAWILIGIIQIRLVSSIGLVDVVEKNATLLSYSEDELVDIKREIQVVDWTCKIETGCNLDEFPSNLVHPHVNRKMIATKELETTICDLKKDVAVRPKLSQFQSLKREFDHFTSSIGSIKRINEFMQELGDSANDSTVVVNKHKIWKNSVLKFILTLKETYPMYCDLWSPLAIALHQTIHGMDILIQAFLKESYGYNSGKLFTTLRGLACFPWINGEIKSTMQLVEEILIPNLQIEGSSKKNCANENILNKLSLFYDKKDLAKFVNSLLRSCLHEVYNVIVTNKELSNESTTLLHDILKEFVIHWQSQEDEKRRLEMEKESLYQFRTQTHCEEPNESEQDEIDRKRLFPTYEAEFSDLNPEPTLEKIEEKVVPETSSSDMGPLNQKTIYTICDVHKKIVTNFTQSRWFNPTKCQGLSQDYMTPFLSRYKVALHLMKHSANVIDVSMDNDLLGGHLVACRVLQEAMLQESDQKLITKNQAPYDIYHDSNISEAVQCRPILEKLDSRIGELLEEWNDHPTLQQIREIIKRILSFSVNCSLMKFVTGLELLLTKSQEWEANAHTGVSLITHLDNITKQIITWRQMELKCWSNCLDTVEHKHKILATKWWLHVYVLVEGYLSPVETEKEEVSVKDIVKTLQQLLEQSTLGEYSSRLNIVLSFHCHLIQLETSKKQQELLNVFWNIYKYYAQFESNVITKLATFRKPIEREVKNFVKIARWNDINFFTVKESVAKSHQTLHKHMKLFEKMVREPVRLAMTDPREKTDQPGNNELTFVGFSRFILPLELKDSYMVTSSQFTSSTLLNKTQNLFTKLRKVSKNFIKTAPYIDEIKELDEFTIDLITAAHELKDLEVNQNLTKEKQISEVKSINLRKRKALSDLFKSLTELGISYRKGLILWKENNATEFVHLPPVDIEVSLQMVESKFNQTEINKCLTSVWNGCAKYFYRSVARLALLHTASENPHKELGVGNLDRIFGFTSHLFCLAQKQHKEIAKIDEDLGKMRTLLDYIFKLTSEESFIFQTQILKDTKEFTSGAIQCMEQFNLLIMSCPALENNDFHSQMNLPYDIPRGFIMSKESDTWCTTVELVNGCLEELKLVHDQLVVKDASVELKTILETLTRFGHQLHQLILLFEQPQEEKSNAFVRSLKFVQESLSSVMKKVGSSLEGSDKQSANFNRIEVEDLEKCAENLVTKILLAIQNIAKEEPTKEDSTSITKEDSTSVTKEMKDFYLRESLIKDINAKIDKMQIIVILELLMKVRNMVDGSLNSSVIRILKTIYPILLQYCNLMQFLFVETVSVQRGICKLNSVLLGIFIELVQKGFCVPEEYQGEVSAGEGATEFQDITGGGIGEGEGVKDVSDRLESEDQLEDAFQEGKEPEKEDQNKKPDIKEEDNGIDMSEDFDGKMHDLDKDEEEDESDDESDDEEELDKEMGDLGDENDADKLDEKMWGSDNEDEDDDEDDEKEEKDDEDGPGAGKSETRLVANEDNKNKDSNDNGDEEKTLDDPAADDDNDEIKPFDDRPCDDTKNSEEPNGDENQSDIEPMEMPEDLKLDAEEEDADAENDGEEVDETSDKIEDKEKEAEEMKGDEHEDGGETEENMEIDEAVDDKMEKPTEEIADDDEEKDENKEETGENPSEEDIERENKFPDPKVTEDDKIQSADDAVDSASAHKTESAKATENAHDDENKEENLDELDAEKDAHGQMESDMEHGSRGKVKSQPEVTVRGNDKAEQYQRKATNQKRTLGDVRDKIHKRLKTIDTKDDENGINPEEPETGDNNQELYEHIENASSKDLQTKDSATLEQAKNQIMLDEKAENEEPVDENDDVHMMSDEEEELTKETTKKLQAKTLKSRKDDAQDDKEKLSGEEAVLNEDEPVVLTNVVARGPMSTFHTNIASVEDQMDTDLDVEQMRTELEEHLAQWDRLRCNDNSEALSIWHQFEMITLPLAQELCEQLRLVLEPSLAAKLKGDYRTGKRLNMRKIIPYIASQFRKDKIWLRRTQPNKRQYQIMLAVDDSSSMADNHVKELAFESLAVISKALTLLEAGQLSIASFGESFSLLHPFHQLFNDVSGAETLKMFSFQQKKTLVAKMLNSATSVMASSRLSTSLSNKFMDTAQLLVILSDGRGLFSEGGEAVKMAIRRAKDANVFVIFVVLDLATNKDSIFDIKVPIFKDGLVPEIRSYMDDFPFPFYIVLQELTSLPAVLSDALRQWFELVTSIE
uniref:Midasin n=1 Tax=Strigamia maritima TaxID=126957 RepID=T1J0I3_STRMM